MSMRLLGLELENWGCHGSLQVDLGSGLQIEGRNGTGKSSILEALRFIFKETARGYTNRVKNGEREAFVKLTFEHEGVTYAVEKRLYVDKPSQALMLAGETQVADNPSSVYDRLQNILSEEVLDKLLYIPQGGLTAVLDRLSGKDGKLEMDRLFGLDRLERVWERAGQEIQEEAARLQVLSDELKKHPDDAGEYGRLLEEYSARERELKQRSDTAEKDLDKILSNLKSKEESLKSLESARKERDSLTKEVSVVQVKLAEANKGLESVGKRLKELGERRRELEGLSAALKSLEKYKSIRELLQELKSVDGGLDGLKDLRDKKQSLDSLEKHLQGKAAAEEALSRLRDSVRKLEEDYAARKADLEQAAKYYKELGGLDGHVKCPRCGQKLNAFIIERETKETAVKIKGLEEYRVKVETRLKSASQELKKQEESVEELRRMEAEARVLRKDVGEREKRVVSLMESADGVRKRLSQAGYGGEKPAVVEENYSEYNRLSGRVQSLRREVEEAASLEAERGQLLGERDLLNKRAAEVEEAVSTLDYSPEAHERASKERDMLSETRYGLESDLKNLEGELRRLGEDRKMVEEKLAAYTGLLDRHTTSKKRVGLLRAAREVFHRDKGLVRYLRETFIERLNRMLTVHFKRFNQNPRYVDVRFDRDYNIVFKTTSGELSVEQVSGGERVQLALALRIALIDLMSPVPLLILDEPFGSLDEVHRELLGEALNRIGEQGQLILVTHVRVDSLQLRSRLDLGGY